MLLRSGVMPWVGIDHSEKTMLHFSSWLAPPPMAAGWDLMGLTESIIWYSTCTSSPAPGGWRSWFLLHRDLWRCWRYITPPRTKPSIIETKDSVSFLHQDILLIGVPLIVICQVPWWALQTLCHLLLMTVPWHKYYCPHMKDSTEVVIFEVSSCQLIFLESGWSCSWSLGHYLFQILMLTQPWLGGQELRNVQGSGTICQVSSHELATQSICFLPLQEEDWLLERWYCGRKRNIQVDSICLSWAWAYILYQFSLTSVIAVLFPQLWQSATCLYCAPKETPKFSLMIKCWTQFLTLP